MDWAAGSVQETRFSWDEWVVISQDCDLDSAENESPEPLVEIQPARSSSVIADWGIRSKILRLSDEFHVSASDPKIRVSPRLLAAQIATRKPEIPTGRAPALKRWLGLRYDRPAVPENLVAIARAIARAVSDTRNEERSDVCHDVLFQATSGSPPQYELAAIVVDSSNIDAVTEWMIEAALAIDSAIGTMAGPPHVQTMSGMSMEWIENSYSANLSNITWHKSGPIGAA